jgi:hypothetical protein
MSEDPKAPRKRPSFKLTLLRVMLVQIATLALLGLLQHTFSR